MPVEGICLQICLHRQVIKS